MTGAIPAPLVAKEVRALAPWWLTSVFVIAADTFAGHYRVMPIGLLAFVTGTLALGAQSVGHEYTNRTLDALLTQPISRTRLFGAKLAVLVPLALALGVIAWLCLTSGDLPIRAPWRAGLFFMLAPLLAVTLAPWMTMMTGSMVAGVVFTAAVPGFLWTALSVAAVAFDVDYGTRWFGLWIGGVVALCAASVIFGWRRFSYLEAVDAAGIEVSMPRLRRASRASLRQPIWMLFQKELHLQQLTFAVALLYLTAWFACAVGARISGGWRGDIVGPLNVLYFAILSLLIGSLASAQERQFGTAEAQMIQPVGAWHQWSVKAGTAIILALALGVGVPMILDRLAPAANMLHLFQGGSLSMISIIAVLTASSLYVSSLSRSGVAALVFSFPAIVAGLLIMQTVGLAAFLTARTRDLGPSTYGEPMDWIIGGFLVGIVALLLWLGGRNHTSAEGGHARILRQALVIGAYLSVTAIALGVLAAGN